MNIINRVKIEGFWGDRIIDIDFHKDVNFLIGVNGSGKTTVINLIAATLLADFQTLDKIDFKKIKIYLSEVDGRKKPKIEVIKGETEYSPFNTILYRIKKKTTAKYLDFSLDELEEEFHLRRHPVSRRQKLHITQLNRGIIAELNSLINVSWLSIHRASKSDRMPSDDSYESSVDKKLNQLSNALTRYFSELSSRVSEEISEFQKNLIVSLLTEETESEIFSSVRKLDLNKEKKSLIEILEKLNISANSQLSRHFEKARIAVEVLNKSSALDLTNLMLLVSSYRSHRVVQAWNDLLKKQETILKPKSTFVKVLNNLFNHKNIHINDRNEIEVTTSSGKIFSIWGLSSGEKQLLIILGEALLQGDSQWIYIADEPELSLHVKWQENLINNLLSINPNLQILCATHSPDIVGVFSDKIFDMEKEVK